MNTNELQWRASIPGELNCSNEVHVWRMFLDLTTVQMESLLGILSVDELARVGRLHFERDQKQFIAARGTLRKILGRYLEKDPKELRFDYNAHGKPILKTEAGNDPLSFNLTHSGAFAMYAVTRTRNIGIDVERVCDYISVGYIARSFFSLGEISSFERTPKNKRSEVFYQYWARKEALLKAIGKGLSFPMDQFDVSLISGRVLSPITLPGENKEREYWYVQDLFPAVGYAAAIAVEGADVDISCWHYST